MAESSAAGPAPRVRLAVGVLDAVVVLAQEIVGSAAASITLVTAEGATTPASSSPWARGLDDAQRAVGSGPCLDAAVGGEICEMRDASRETRWPSYARTALAAGVLSSLSIPLPLDDELVGSLNVFARHADVFTADHAVGLRRLAAMAAAALGASGRMEPARALAVVDQAKGILMGAGCSAAQALDQLGRTAQQEGRGVREVAADLVRSTAAG